MEQLRKEKQECLNSLQHSSSAADIESDEMVRAFISDAYKDGSCPVDDDVGNSAHIKFEIKSIAENELKENNDDVIRDDFSEKEFLLHEANNDYLEVDVCGCSVSKSKESVVDAKSSATDIKSDEMVCAFVSGSVIVFPDNKDAAHADTDVQKENNANDDLDIDDDLDVYE
eukprot:15366188-Ditylum_brightwellii.AAC.1